MTQFVELVAYYVMPNIMLFGLLYKIGKDIEKLGFFAIDYALENWDEIKKYMPH